MKQILLSILLCFAFQINYSQETYTIDGETIELKTEIEGRLDLLWNVTNGEFRYFVRTEDGSITELKNTRSEGQFLEEYKVTLNALADGIPAQKVKFRLYNLMHYIDTYNASIDSSYTSTYKKSTLNFRLGFSGGITNNPFVENPDNVKVPLVGLELELYESKVKSRHSGFLQARHTFDTDEFSYSTTEFSLGYRYRIVNQSSFSIYGQVKLATFHFTEVTITDENDNDINRNDTSFEIPLIFGIGSDIKVGKNSYITIIYGELFGLLVENQGNFSTDIAIGYKFNL
jgi:hypothetical protein